MGFRPWKPYEQHVQSGIVDGKFASGAFITISAGPPSLSVFGGQAAAAAGLNNADGSSLMVLPIGLIQSFSVSQSSQVIRLFEIGSERSVALRGRTMGQVVLGRALYWGPSLLRAMYAYYQDLVPPTIVRALFTNVGLLNMPNPHNVRLPPGYENLFLNLSSDLFMQPIGLMIKIHDNDEETLGAEYCEQTMVNSHGLSADANGVLLSENVAATFERAMPVACQTLSLISAGLNDLLATG